MIAYFSMRRFGTGVEKLITSARHAGRKYIDVTWRVLASPRLHRFVMAIALFTVIVNIVPSVATVLGWLLLWVCCLFASCALMGND